MARTPLFGWLQQVVSGGAEATARDMRPVQVVGAGLERRVSRRDVLKP